MERGSPPIGPSWPAVLATQAIYLVGAGMFMAAVPHVELGFLSSSTEPESPLVLPGLVLGPVGVLAALGIAAWTTRQPQPAVRTLSALGALVVVGIGGSMVGAGVPDSLTFFLNPWLLPLGVAFALVMRAPTEWSWFWRAGVLVVASVSLLRLAPLFVPLAIGVADELERQVALRRGGEAEPA